MSHKSSTKTNNRNGNRVTTTVSRSGDTTRVTRTLEKKNGILDTYFLGDKKTLSDKSYKKNR